MRKVIALLVAVLMVASTIDAASFACVGPFPTVASSHSCCPEGAAMTAPSPACCAMAQDTAQRGPAEARVDPPVLQVVLIGAGAVQPAAPTHGAQTRGAPHLPPAVPLYLQQLSLLI